MAPMNAINRASIVLEIQYKDLKMLFIGDSDSALWYEYLEEKYQVIKKRRKAWKIKVWIIMKGYKIYG